MVSAMLRPDVFGALATHAGDALFEYCYQRDFPSAVRALRLSGGVGYYEARVYARYRDLVPRLYAELIDRHGNPLSDDFQREKRKLGGIERYLVQLWRDS